MKRTTIKSRIAAATSIRGKINATFGPSPTPIDNFVERVAMLRAALRSTPPHGFAQFQRQRLPQWKGELANEFRDFFFAALLRDDPAPFEALLCAMSKHRARNRHGAPLDASAKTARRLRALLLLFDSPRPPKTWREIMRRLDRWHVGFTDQAQLTHDLHVLGIPFSPRSALVK